MSGSPQVDALQIFRAAVDAVRPSRLIEAFPLRDLLPTGQVTILGAGKAAMSMAGAVERQLPDVTRGMVVVPHGYPSTLPETECAPKSIEVRTGGHPDPDPSSVTAALRALEIAGELTDEDLMLVLISGGGSALWTCPPPGVELEAVRCLARDLSRAGADIHELNTVRRHLSRIAGGRLAAAAFPASTIALIISDVIGDDPSVIASGPTIPDPSNLEDAVNVLKKYDLWRGAPGSIRILLERGLHREEQETPGRGDDRLKPADYHLIGSNKTAVDAAAARARAFGYEVIIQREPLQGEAREVGRVLGRACSSLPVGTCLIAGGETTVTVTGDGKGGRNQEVALAAAMEFQGDGRPLVVLSGGTDGIDGPTDAAGAWVTPETAARARSAGIDPAACLEHNDAYRVFRVTDQLVMTGPTHTNVMDVAVCLRASL